MLLAVLGVITIGRTGPAAAAPDAGLRVVAAYSAGPGRPAAALVDVPAGSRPGAFSVTAAGRPLGARSSPVFSGATAIGLVIDASAPGERALPDGLSGATSLLLQAPPGARAAVVADSRPPRAVTPAMVNATDAAAQLTTVRAGGQRDTRQAIAVALRSLATALGPRLVVLYTGAGDLPGVDPADLATQLRAAGAVLAVVTTSSSTGYWAGASAATGGAVVRTTPHAAISAFDRIVKTLSSRYLVTFAAPARLPAQVTVQTGTGGAALHADVTIPSADVTIPSAAAAPTAAARPGARPARPRPLWLAALGLLAAAALLGIALLVIGRRPTREQQLTRPLDVLPWRREDAEPTPGEPEPVPAPSPPPPLVKRSVAARGAPLGDAAYAPTAPFEAIADAAAALVEAQRRARAAGLAARAAAEAAQARENSPDGERDDGQARP